MRPLDVTIPRLGSFCKLLLSLSPLPVISASENLPKISPTSLSPAKLDAERNAVLEPVHHLPPVRQLNFEIAALARARLRVDVGEFEFDT